MAWSKFRQGRNYFGRHAELFPEGGKTYNRASWPVKAATASFSAWRWRYREDNRKNETVA
ncbi:MAG: hypothetical protein ACUVTH_11705 [Thermogutta sp.]